MGSEVSVVRGYGTKSAGEERAESVKIFEVILKGVGKWNYVKLSIDLLFVVFPLFF